MSLDIERSVMVERLAKFTEGFAINVPHNKALGMRVESCEDGVTVMYLDWREDLAGNSLSGVLHGGVITALLDAASGGAVFMKLAKPKPIATLDLRIDYLRPATPRTRVYARAECYHLTRNVAFVRATAYHPGQESQAIAASMGSFMLGTRSGRRKDEDATTKATR